MTQTLSFEDLENDELLKLQRKLASANSAIVAEYGNASILNVELIDLYDELADYMTGDRGLVVD
jgi:hypothetical protein